MEYQRVLCVLLFLVLIGFPYCQPQKDVTLPFTSNSLRNIIRTKMLTAPGRVQKLSDCRILHYYGNDTSTFDTYKFTTIKKVLSSPNFDLNKPTVLYAHGYVELADDESVVTIVSAYIKNGGYNILVLDWANLGFGNYVFAAMDVQWVGKEAGHAVSLLLSAGLQPDSLHLVGHSLGAHIAGYIARRLAEQNVTVTRLTGLDPALPGFYPPLSFLGTPISETDAKFVDIIHTDGGRYGTPLKTGHADFWPNGGEARQPGCPINSFIFTYEDFCSHWRSWKFFAESLTGGEFPARPCTDYDSFLRGECAQEPIALMGINAKPGLRGNFYLRTAGNTPYSLGARGAE